VRFLIDTHVFLWAASDDSQLSNDARLVIGDRRNEIFVSAVEGMTFMTRDRDSLSYPVASIVA